jgi:hypothetical protein
MRTLLSLFLLIWIIPISTAAPKAIAASDVPVPGFSLSQEYVISNPMLKDKVIVRAGKYAPWFKDTRGIYYGQNGSQALVYISFAKDIAWTAVINKEFHYAGPIPTGAIQAAATVLFAELIAPKAGSVTKQMSCKKDFMKLISWEEIPKTTGAEPVTTENAGK